MGLDGRIEIAVSAQRAWTALTDPAQVAACLPGAPRVERVDATHYRAPVRLEAGFLRASTTLEVALTEAAPPDAAAFELAATLLGGTFRTGLRLAFAAAAADRTAVSWSAEVALGGSLASFRGPVEAAARAQAEAILSCLKARLEAET